MTKYYQLTHNDDTVGVIKVVDGEIPISYIKAAIEEHLDEEVDIAEVEFFDEGYAVEITYTTKDGEGIVYGQQTWLYF